jgi:hypothetical protein
MRCSGAIQGALTVTSTGKQAGAYPPGSMRLPVLMFCLRSEPAEKPAFSLKGALELCRSDHPCISNGKFPYTGVELRPNDLASPRTPRRTDDFTQISNEPAANLETSRPRPARPFYTRT